MIYGFLNLIVSVVVLLAGGFVEESEIEEQDGAHHQSLVFLGGIGGERNGEVIGITDHLGKAALRSLLEGGEDFTSGALDVEVDGLATLTGGLAMHTELAAVTDDLVLNVIVLVVDVKGVIAASPGVSDFTQIGVGTVFSDVDGDFGSVQAQDSASAFSFDGQEGSAIDSLVLVF